MLRAPGRLQKSIWTPGRHQAGKDLWTAWGGTREAPASRKGPFGQPARHQGGIWDSLGGTREVPGRQERTIWDSLGGTREVPERQERTLWTAWEAPRRQERIN